MDYFSCYSLKTSVLVEKGEFKPGETRVGPEDAVGPAEYELVDGCG